MSDVTHILLRVERGDPSAAAKLLPLVYDELRKLAASKLAQEKPGQTLQATALVHEAYLRLVGGNEMKSWSSRSHFFAAAAEAMRRILVDVARHKKSERHGGQWKRVELSEIRVAVDLSPDQMLAIDECLEELAVADPQAAQVVKLHCFAGLSTEQTAELLGISPRTAYRDYAFARGWLFKKLEGVPPSEDL